jgi:chemotaxis protein MotA
MKAATIIGIVVALVGMALGAMMEGSQIPAFFNVPALIIIMSGLFGATLASVGMEAMKSVPKLYKKAFSPDVPDPNERVDLLVGFAEKARREGLLALDDETGRIEDGFTRKGLQLVVDGTDPDVVAEILEQEIEGMQQRHHASADVFEKAGGFAPTIGILGTVMGLVHVLENLDKPETLGPSISGAFIATLYGVGSANVIFLPIASRLKGLSAKEVVLRTMTLEGILAIQAGENPRVVAEKLRTFVPPDERRDEDDDAAPARAGGASELDAEPAAVAA